MPAAIQRSSDHGATNGAQKSPSIYDIAIGVFLGMMAFSIVSGVFWYLLLRAAVGD